MYSIFDILFIIGACVIILSLIINYFATKKDNVFLYSFAIAFIIAIFLYISFRNDVYNQFYKQGQIDYHNKIINELKMHLDSTKTWELIKK